MLETDVTRPRLLEVTDLHAWYGDSKALHGIDLHALKGEVICLVGRNGAGKSTTLRSIIGSLKRRTGSIRFRDKETIAMPPRSIAGLGIGYVPEERGIFATLTVEENLKLPRIVHQERMSFEDIYELFPNLKTRLKTFGTKLSGGEQQMLSIARVLQTGSRFLMMDEPTEGLAPVVVDHIADSIELLKQRDFTIVLVEANLKFASRLADRFYVVEQGRIVDHIEPSREVGEGHVERLQAYIGV